jgi:hypothetical protein
MNSEKDRGAYRRGAEAVKKTSPRNGFEDFAELEAQ